MIDYLQTRGTAIMDGRGRSVSLRGVNLGGWLMMEAYIMQAPNRAEQVFKKKFREVLGPQALTQFEKENRSVRSATPPGRSNNCRYAGRGFLKIFWVRRPRQTIFFPKRKEPLHPRGYE